MTIVRQEVCRLLGGDTSGHSDEHVERVARLAERFANEYKKEAASMDEVLLTAWLHDVDDYKLVGKKQADELNNATSIMVKAGVAADLQDAVRLFFGIICNNHLYGIKHHIS